MTTNALHRRKRSQVHWQKTLWHGERDAIAYTACGKSVVLSSNRQRLTQDLSEVTCRRCRQIRTQAARR